MRNMPTWANSSYNNSSVMPRSTMQDNYNTDMGKSYGCQDNKAVQKVLAMVYAPYQNWKDIYDPATALVKGTIFEELFKPFCPCGKKEAK